MKELDPILIKTQTLHWIRSFVVKYNICPFAKHVLDQDGVVVNVAVVTGAEEALEALMSAIYLLDGNAKVETILLVFPTFLNDFFDYLDFVELAEDLMAEQGCEGVYQLATFHPDYCFAGVDASDVTNFTNRSPYPMLHLLREVSIEKAIEFYGNTEDIPENNIKTMRELGLERVKQITAV